ncbi:hypothetical protein NUU61_002372 [Penicillium alfredii]|uniref:Fucose-specific lectin n=1 Tax=Penicillium alfredii TaxID=1506179 RepID=A0A9W9FRG0_9EURO|nr:uncharacterized protein NUU61_002372 [Penicillium alfredii]KAJ5105025.1 hypothetical protein NUU61_002372 [Penicillium alfredii]
MAPLTNQITVLPNPAVDDNPRDIPGSPGSVRSSHKHLKFGVTGNRQLSLQIYSTTNTNHPTGYVDNNAPTGTIHEPGTLAGAVQNKIAVVYGIASSGSGETGNVGICKLSPYYNPIASDDGKGPIQTNLWSLTACDNRDQRNWIFFLRKEGTDQDSKIVLVQLVIDELDQAAVTPLKVPTTIGAKSRLTSFYEKIPFVFFVHEGKRRGIYYINSTQAEIGESHPFRLQSPATGTDGENTAIPIRNTNSVIESSPLAIVTNVSTHKNNQVFLQLTLYYVDNNGFLSYVLGTLEKDQITWLDAGETLENIEVDQTSSLCAINGADGKTHYIYLVPDGGAAGAYKVFTTTPWQVSPPPS